MDIVKFKRSDRAEFLKQCKAFYDSNATLHPFNEEAAKITFRRVMERHENLWGYMLIDKANNKKIGYALVSSYWCNEEGGDVLVLDELYISPDSRHNGYGSLFLRWLEEHAGKYVKALTLEVLTTNQTAQSLYRKDGLEPDGFITYTKEISAKK